MKLLSIVLFALTSTTGLNAQSVKGRQLWIPVDIKWHRVPGAPRDVHTRTAASVVLYFGANGEFVRDECWLIRNGKTISISNGDPHEQYVGRITTPILDGMQIEYRLVRRTTEKTGETLPGPYISETASTRAISGLALEGRFFHSVQLADESDYIKEYGNLAQQYTQP